MAWCHKRAHPPRTATGCDSSVNCIAACREAPFSPVPRVEGVGAGVAMQVDQTAAARTAVVRTAAARVEVARAMVEAAMVEAARVVGVRVVVERVVAREVEGWVEGRGVEGMEEGAREARGMAAVAMEVERKGGAKEEGGVVVEAGVVEGRALEKVMVARVEVMEAVAVARGDVVEGLRRSRQFH